MWWSKWKKPRYNGFRKFDVLSRIGDTLKFVVERDDGIDYKLVELSPPDMPGSGIVGYVMKCSCESQYVKVGRWNPDTRKVEEDE